MKILFYIFFTLIITSFSFTQISDTVKYPWVFSPINVTKEITGTFGEYRSTSVNGHFHDGTDVPAPSGTPVLAVLPGTVTVAYDDGQTGNNSYVRVSSTLNGQVKDLTYYHTRPTVSVGTSVIVGQQISTVAIDHVHLIDYRIGGGGGNATRINSIRPDGGFTPYLDIWKPRIRFVRFFVDNLDIELPPLGLTGKIDIAVHVEEQNGVSSSSVMNNGTYEIGYKILSADRQTIIFDPPDNGWRYRFYNLPANSFVNTAYYRPLSSTSQHVYLVTNGTGANSVENTQVVQNNFWDIDLHPYGDYNLMVFSRDTRNNADTVFIPIRTSRRDLVPPQQPTLKSITKISPDSIQINWSRVNDADLKGYRLFISNEGRNFQLFEDENSLTQNMTEKKYRLSKDSIYYFKIVAVDTATPANQSLETDTYGIRLSDSQKRILIVDGFNRFGGSGSWSRASHDFLIYHAEILTNQFESSHQSAIANDEISLSNYDGVIWFTGDESTVNETFSGAEQTRIANYLNSGGKLFVSGSEIGWDLVGSGTASPSDIQFYTNYLKARYVSDASGVFNISGVPPIFQTNFTFNYGSTSVGSPYNEDFPDVIDTVGGSFPILRYTSNATAGIAYSGRFGTGIQQGGVAYIAFPFETIPLRQPRNRLLNSMLTYFDLITKINGDELAENKFNYILNQNYPNPFNPSTVISWQLPTRSYVKLKIYDLLGKEIVTLFDGEQNEGNHKIDFNVSDKSSNIASGVYFYKLEVNGSILTRKMLLMK